MGGNAEAAANFGFVNNLSTNFWREVVLIY